jgi:hypothetical protein
LLIQNIGKFHFAFYVSPTTAVIDKIFYIDFADARILTRAIANTLSAILDPPSSILDLFSSRPLRAAVVSL